MKGQYAGKKKAKFSLASRIKALTLHNGVLI